MGGSRSLIPSRRFHPVDTASGPRFEAHGTAGRLLAQAARAGLRLAGASAPAIASVAGERYRAIEGFTARRAWSALGARTKVTGFEHARGGPYIVMPLHESLVDPLLLASLPLHLAYLARDEIWEWPSVGRLLQAGGHICATASAGTGARTTAARRFLRGARELIARGDSIVVFPQGSVLGIEIAFNRGAFQLARTLDVPVLPVVIAGTHRVWEYPYSPLMRRRQPVTLQVLPSVPAAEAYSRRHAIEQEMRAAALVSTHGSPRRFVPARDGYWDGYRFEIAPQFVELAREIDGHRDGIHSLVH